MKNLYLKAGKAKDFFNYLRDNFNGILTCKNDEYNLVLESAFARGNIKCSAFSEGMACLQFDMVLYEDISLSMEPFLSSPIFFIYCSEGNIHHSFGEQGEKKIIKKQQTGTLKSISSVNSILHFEKYISIKFCAIVVETDASIANKQNDELVKKLKNTFLNIKEDYLDIVSQNASIAKKIRELNILPHKGIARNLAVNRILEKILEMEIEEHTDGFSKIAETVSSFTLQQIDDIKSVSNAVRNISLELFTTDFIFQKAMQFTNKLQKELKILFSRTVHEFLIYIRIERGRI